MKLGSVQQAVLRALAEHGRWDTSALYGTTGAGWMWDTPSNTLRVMESLVARGVARKVRRGRVVYF